ncbi:MAG: hypothetical protein RBQ89_03695 [Sphaerochaeta sp.]|nr:hypothetical protein [Sphaerochaeta sp.]MDD4301309.1 hypothetical protein [Sphaerochaeta sp.]MDY0243903.1 hypothetical protein [Sphaerochaeta sp.]
MFCLLSPLGAKEPTPNDVTVAIAAITDTTICAVAAFLNTPKLDLPGSNLYFRDGETLPHILTFQEADLGEYLPVFLATKEGGTSFFASLMQAARGPLNDVAIQYLTVHAWEEGHAVLKGAAVTDWGEGVTLPSLMGTVIQSGKIPDIIVTADVVVDGRRVSTSVRVEGKFLLHSDDEGFFAVRPLTLKINGRDLEV